MKPTIAITIGDFNGIGPEIALKSAVHPSIRRICTPVLVGPFSIFEHATNRFKVRKKLQKAVFPWKDQSSVPVLDVGDGLWADIAYGKIAKSAGKSAGIAIEKAVELCVAGRAQAMVTAPVAKEAMHLAGYNFPGQTEMITMLSRSQKVAMMLVAGDLRVGLVTIHTPLRNVADHITREKIIEKVAIVRTSLERDFKITKPRIAVLALNPHAGEGGLIGKEEQQIIIPALEELRAQSIQVDGPYPADAFFGTGRYRQYDTFLAMYHDQGLIPLKMTSFEKVVNFSAGLAVIRTSPGHGTAFDIAGKDKASISSMVEAIKLAVQITTNRWSSSKT